ncbi:Zinc finger cchc domain-containing protein 7 [Biomphalaria glabrata]
MEETYYINEDSCNSEPEDFIDHHELEVALYSQVHFDAGPGSETWNKDTLVSNNNRSFHIEVKKLTSTLSTAKQSLPSCTGDFIGFSELPSDNSQKCSTKASSPSTSVSKKKGKIAKASKTKDKKEFQECTLSFEIDKKGNPNSIKDSSSLDIICINNAKKSTPSNDNTVKSAINDDIIELGNKTNVVMAAKEDIVMVSGETSKQKKTALNSGIEQNKEKLIAETSPAAAEMCLPFKLTKSKKVASDELLQPEISTKKSKTDITSQANNKQNVPKIQDFLHLSKSDTSSTSKVKKKVSKLDAAVKIRKPTVCIRRPPLVAKFNPDSDTDTDYSDSECSVRESPAKPLKKTSARKLTKSSGALAKTLFAKKDPEDKTNQLQTEVNLDPDSETEGDEEEGEVGTENSDDCILVERSVLDEANTIELSEETSSQESEDETTDHSEGELTSSEDDSPLDVTPNLEFNLAGGMSALLSSKSPSSEEWKIDEQDRFKTNSLTSRYFSPLKVQCRNCKVEGHLSRDCPKPMKKKCVFCAEEGHISVACPDAICYNCDTPGHRNNECSEPKRNWHALCNRCYVAGHREEMCPDRWRQYHISTDPDCFNTQRKDATNDRVYCYNCGSQGHFGHDCQAARFNKFVPASYPLIAHYDTRKNRLKSNDTAAKHKKHSARGKQGRSESEKDLHKKKKKSKADKKDELKETSNEFVAPGSLFKKKSKSHSSHKSTKNFSKGDHQKQVSPASGKSRKRQHELYEPKDEIEDLQEDFESHQVNHNEWWNSDSKQPPKKMGKFGRNQGDQYYEEHWDGRRNRADLGESRSQGNHEQGKFWDRNYREMNHYGPRPPANAQYMRGNIGRNLMEERFHQSYPGSQNQGFQQSNQSNRDFRQGNQPNRDFRQGNQSNRDFRQGNQSNRGGMKHSQSWPVIQSKKNTGGFQFQNDQFAMLKNNCDRNQYQKNW